MDEKTLVPILANLISEKDHIIYINTNPASYKYRKYWEKWFGDDVPPLQPQVDLILVDKKDFKIRAIEVKFFKQTKKRKIDKSYYCGIDECIALMNFGFESVALWHCFEEAIPFKEIKNYVFHLMNLRQSLNLRFDYTCFRIGEEKDHYKIETLLTPEYGYWSKGIPQKVIDLEFDNPLRYQPEAQKILDFIRSVLRIPTKK